MVNRGMEAVWTNIDAGEWREAACAALAPLQQSSEYGEICRRLGREILRARLEGTETRGYAQVLVRRAFGGRRLALLSRGPFWVKGQGDGVAGCAALLKTIPMSRFSAMIAASDTAEALAGIPVMTPVTVAELSLYKDAKTQRACLHGKWRNRLVRSEEMDLTIEQIAPTTGMIERLLSYEATQQKRRGYRNLPPPFLRGWAQCFPEKTHVLVSRNKGEINAAMVFLRHGNTASYYLGWRNVDAGVPVHNLMLWRGVRLLSHLNVQRLDLGPLDTLNTPGLARFKLGTGARAHRIGETYLLGFS